MKKIAIIGHGYVGKAMANYFKDHFNVFVYDPFLYPERQPVNLGNSDIPDYILGASKEEVNQCDLVVICVPTPMRPDGMCDTSIVEDVLSWLSVRLVLIKSTIPPGTSRRLAEQYKTLNIVFSPEYIGEGKYYVPVHKGYPHPTDMKQHEFFIFGGNRVDTAGVINFFLKVSGPDPFYAQTDWETAEVCKYMENSWGAMKVTFFNEFFDIAKTFGVDYKELRELFLLDGRTERMHTAVFEDKRGFGGKCFPKDVNAIVVASTAAGYEPHLLNEVLQSNERFTSQNGG